MSDGIFGGFKYICIYIYISRNSERTVFLILIGTDSELAGYDDVTLSVALSVSYSNTQNNP